MRIELDHLFVCTARGAPEGEKLVQSGLNEGPPNDHPGQGTAHRERWFLEHPIGIREITHLTLRSPVPLTSRPSRILIESGILHIGMGPSYLLEIEFDHNRRKQRIDFRPELPIVFQP